QGVHRVDDDRRLIPEDLHAYLPWHASGPTARSGSDQRPGLGREMPGRSVNASLSLPRVVLSDLDTEEPTALQNSSDAGRARASERVEHQPAGRADLDDLPHDLQRLLCD